MLDGARIAGATTVRRRGVRLRRVARLTAAVRSDMRRLSVVMAAAALYTYMHRLIVERAYTHSEKLPGGLARLDVTFEQLLARLTLLARPPRAAPHSSRPRVAVKRQLRDRLLRETFQSYDSVGRALGMAGLSGNWTAIGTAMTPSSTPSAIKQRLDEIVQRANQIVHEGDYERP